MQEIHSCISLIEKAAGLPFNPPANINDLAFQLCNMGGELVSVEELGKSLSQTISSELMDKAIEHTKESWVNVQLLQILG